MGSKNSKDTREDEIAGAARQDRRAPSMSQVALQQHLDLQKHEQRLNHHRAVAHQRAVTQAVIDHKRLEMAQMRAQAQANALKAAQANQVAQANQLAQANQVAQAKLAQAHARTAAHANQLAQAQAAAHAQGPTPSRPAVHSHSQTVHSHPQAAQSNSQTVHSHSQTAYSHSQAAHSHSQAAHSNSHAHARMKTMKPTMYRPQSQSLPQRGSRLPTGHGRTQTDYHPPRSRPQAPMQRANSERLPLPQPHQRMASELPTPHFADGVGHAYTRGTPGLHSRTNTMEWNQRSREDSISRGPGGPDYTRRAPARQASAQQASARGSRPPSHQRTFSESSTQSSYLPPLPIRNGDRSLRPYDRGSPSMSDRFVPRATSGPRPWGGPSYSNPPPAHHRDLSTSDTQTLRATPHRRFSSSNMDQQRTFERERSLSEISPTGAQQPHVRRASGVARQSRQYSISRRPHRAPKAVSADDLGRPNLKISRKRSTRSEPARTSSSNRTQSIVTPVSPGFEEDFTLHGGVGQTHRHSRYTSMDIESDASGETPGNGGLRSRTEDLHLAAENERLRRALEFMEREANHSKSSGFSSRNDLEIEDEMSEKDTQRHLRLEMAALRRKAVREKSEREREEAARKEVEQQAEEAKNLAERNAAVASVRARRAAAEAAEQNRIELEAAKREAERQSEIARNQRADLEAAKTRAEQKTEAVKREAEQKAEIARKERADLEAAKLDTERRASTARREHGDFVVSARENERKAAAQKAGLEAARRAAEKRAEVDARKQGELADEIQRMKDAALENEMQYDEIAAELQLEIDLQSESKRTTEPTQEPTEPPQLGILLPEHLKAAGLFRQTPCGTPLRDLPNENAPDAMKELSNVFANIAKLRTKADKFQENLQSVKTPHHGSEEKLLPDKKSKIDDELAIFEATLDGFKTPGGHLLGRSNSLARADSLLGIEGIFGVDDS